MTGRGASRGVMRRNQIPSAAERERLLAGERLAGYHVSELLSAATTPAHSTEPSGLESALAAFRSAPAAAAVPTARRTPVLKSLLSGLVATKVIAGVAGAAAVGGVALAATTGHLGDGGHSADAPGQTIAAAHQPDATDSGSASSSADDSSSAAASSSAASTSTSSATDSAHAPNPSLVGLCHAWQAHERSHSDHSKSAAHSAWAKSPAFSVLVSTAGGTGAVDGYCTVLLTPSASASTAPSVVPSTHPTHPAHPSQAVTTHANHKPSAVPSHSHPVPSHTNHKPTPSASATP